MKKFGDRGGWSSNICQNPGGGRGGHCFWGKILGQNLNGGMETRVMSFIVFFINKIRIFSKGDYKWKTFTATAKKRIIQI
jgi:hypothetical protein